MCLTVWGYTAFHLLIRYANRRTDTCLNLNIKASSAFRQCIIWAATRQNQQNDCVPSEDSDQPGHSPSLIRVFAVCMKKSWVPCYPLNAQRRLISLGGFPGWSESSLGAQSLCWCLPCRGSILSNKQTQFYGTIALYSLYSYIPETVRHILFNHYFSSMVLMCSNIFRLHSLKHSKSNYLNNILFRVKSRINENETIWKFVGCDLLASLSIK